MKCKQLIHQAQMKLQTEVGLLSFLSNLSCFQVLVESSRPFRQRIYTPMQTLICFLKQVLHADKSCSHAVSDLATQRCLDGKKDISVLTGGYVKARARLPEALIGPLVKQIAKASDDMASPSWMFHHRRVVLCDGTTVAMPDTTANRDAFPPHNNGKKASSFPLARIVALMSLTTGHVLDYAIDAFSGKGTGEVSLLRRLLGSLNEQDIFLADGLYCHFFLIHNLMMTTVDVLVPGLKQRRYDFSNDKDHVAVWKKPRRPEGMSLEDYQHYPASITIREVKVDGRIYMTTLLDAKTYPKQELHALYKRRWVIETRFNHIKTTMNMDTLSCKSPAMIRKEIGLHLLAYNLIKHYVVQACLAHQALPWHVSFKGTIQLLEPIVPGLRYGSLHHKMTLYRQFMRLVVTKKVGHRPGRVEPRLVRQRRQKYPNLKKTRQEERQKLTQLAFDRMREHDALAA